MRDLDFGGVGERELLNKLRESLIKKYHLGSDKSKI